MQHELERTVRRLLVVVLLLVGCFAIGGSIPGVFAVTNQAPEVKPATSIAGGDYSWCVVTSAGGVKCWGYNLRGQLGNDTLIDSNVPVDVVGLSSGVVSLAHGSHFACALLSSGGVKCWGFNSSGQLGNNSLVDSKVPVDVIGLSSGVASISAGIWHVCAVMNAGGVKCWGDNRYGQLGDDSLVNRGVPVDVIGISGQVLMTDAGWHTCAVLSSGGVKCWGFNGAGQLGNNSLVDSKVPVDVTGLASSVIAVTAGGSGQQSCALLSSGAVKCWGSNFYGELGNSTNVNSKVPLSVTGLSAGVVTISTTAYQTCALLSSGGAKCWGYNGYGELGDGTAVNRNAPVNVAGLPGGIIAVAAGTYSTCALTAAGGVKCWGYGGQGTLGNGVSANSFTPVDVVGLSSGIGVTTTIPPDTTAPTLSSSSLLANGRTVRLVFNEVLHANTAEASAFVVTATAVNHIPTSVTVSGSSIDLALPITLEGSASVTVAYVQPSSNSSTSNSAVQDLVGNDVASFSGRSVTNNSTADGSAPVASWSAPTSPSSSRTLSYTLAFSESVSGIAAGDFRTLGTATGCVATPSASSTSVSVTVSVSCTSDGTVLLELLQNTVVDQNLNTGPSENTTAPQVTITSVSATTTTSTSLVSSTTTTSLAPTSTTISATTTTNTSLVSSTTTTSLVPTSTSTIASVTIATGSSPEPLVAAANDPIGALGRVTTTLFGPADTAIPVTAPTISTLLETKPVTPAVDVLSKIDVPETEIGGASVVVGGVRTSITITRENNELLLQAGPISARIWAVAKSGGKVALDVDGRLRLMPGDSVTVDLEGLDAQSPVEVRLYSDPVLLGRSRVASSGLLVASYEIPSGTEAGDHTVVMLGSGKGDDVTVALSIAIGEKPNGINQWLILFPMAFAVLCASLVPIAVRRRRKLQ